MELYSGWCGPCKSVLPTFKRIRIDKEDEMALEFLTVSARAMRAHAGAREASDDMHATAYNARAWTLWGAYRPPTDVH